MNKQIKLLKVLSATKYVVALNSDDFETLWCFHAGAEDEYVLFDFLLERIGHAFHDYYFNDVNCSLDIWIDYDLDCNSVRKMVENAMSDYFKLALEHIND